MFRAFFLLVVAVLLASCDSKTPDFYFTKGNLKYKYHDISEDGKSPAIGDFLTVLIEYKSQSGDVIYSSLKTTYDGEDVIQLGKPTIDGGIEEGFAQLLEGDSVTFYINSQKFYESYLKTDLPKSLNSDEDILITLRLIKIESPKEYASRIKKEDEIAEMQEFQGIDSVVKSWELAGDSVQEFGGIYMVKTTLPSLDTIRYGTPIGLYYRGYYANGEEFYNNQENEYPDEFKVGVDGQNIEGMKIALLHLTLGQSAKILVPSYLGFNEELIKKRILRPYQSLIFELETVRLN